MFYDPAIQEKYKALWEKLQNDWATTFGTIIDDMTLAHPPTLEK